MGAIQSKTREIQDILGRSISSLLTGAALAVCFVVAVGGYESLISPMSYDRGFSLFLSAKDQYLSGNWQQAMRLVAAISPESAVHQQAQQMSAQWQQHYQERQQVVQAWKLVKANQMEAAFKQLAEIPTDSPAYPDAQKLMRDWSGRLLKLAQKQYDAGQLESATQLIQAIPKSSSQAPLAQQTLKQWQQTWMANTRYLKSAQIALNQENWQTAATQAEKISSHPYWKTRKQQVLQKANRELDAIAQAQRASVVSESSTPTSSSAEAPASEPSPERDYSSSPVSRRGDSVVPGMDCSEWVPANNTLGGYFACRSR